MTKRQRTEGARQLGRLGIADADIAARLKCSQPEVNRWKTGVRLPSPKSRERMRAALGIPLAAWTTDVDETPRTVVRRGRPPTPVVEVTGQVLDYEPVAVAPRGPTPAISVALSVAAQAEELRALVRQGIEAVSDPSMPPGERFRYLSECHKLLEKLGRLTGESLMVAETRIVRLPAFRLIVDRLVGALRKWPEAQAAVADELDAMGGR